MKATSNKPPNLNVGNIVTEYDWDAIGQSLDRIDQYVVARFLHAELNRRQQNRKSYSQRAFARDLTLSSGDLSKVMRGLKFLSVETVERITKLLNLSPTLSRVLVISAAMRRSKGHGSLTDSLDAESDSMRDFENEY